MMEVILSLTLVATIMLVSLSASANMMRNRLTTAQGVQAQVLAGYFLDEISTLEFRDPSDAAVFGPEPGESTTDRDSLNDIDDFHGFEQVTPTFRDGHFIPGYKDWRVEVRIIPLAIDGDTLNLSTDEASQYRLIGVVVTDLDGRAKTFRTLVSMMPTDRPSNQSFERLRRIEVSFSDQRKLNVVVPLRNTPEPVY